MEALTRLVTESLARYGLDRPVDYRRLQWSRWFRCESLHSLLFVPSKPGVFAIAEEVMDFGSGSSHVGTAALGCPDERSSSDQVWDRVSDPVRPSEARRIAEAGSRKPEADPTRRMLAVLQFCEDDDMAFVLDRMLSRENPMRARLLAGRCFIRYVVIEEESQRRSICNALNQWLVSSGEKATGIGAHFASSLEGPSVGRTVVCDSGHANVGWAISSTQKPELKSIPEGDGSPSSSSHPGTSIPCTQPFPSGF